MQAVALSYWQGGVLHPHGAKGTGGGFGSAVKPRQPPQGSL